MGDLTNNFSRWEFTCRCCKRNKIEMRFVRALQKLSDYINRWYSHRKIDGEHIPIYVLSGYRCKKHNKEIGGADHSWHPKGLAGDIFIPGFTIEETMQAAEQVPEFRKGGIKGYRKKHMTHVDMRDTGKWREIE